MFGRLTRDESGMVLGLAIIMILVVGVMGAGLLIFVRNDLEAVVEVNQGRKALEAADAGIQLAEERLRQDAEPESYDGDADEDSAWSYTETGKDITFEGSSANVKVRYLQPANKNQAGKADYAPEVLPEGRTDYPDDRNYFQIISEGVAGDARRIVESIYRTRPGEGPRPYTLERWSWRECYSKDCK